MPILIAEVPVCEDQSSVAGRTRVMLDGCIFHVPSSHLHERAALVERMKKVASREFSEVVLDALLAPPAPVDPGDALARAVRSFKTGGPWEQLEDALAAYGAAKKKA